jgi:hypothetical protein
VNALGHIRRKCDGLLPLKRFKCNALAFRHQSGDAQQAEGQDHQGDKHFDQRESVP